MSAGLNNPMVDGFVERVARWRHMLVPLGILMLLGVLVVPLSPVILDILLAANIALAAIILLTTVYMKRSLDFSAFLAAGHPERLPSGELP